MEQEAEAREEKAKELRVQARALQEKARLEDISVRQVDYWKKTKKGDRIIPGGFVPGTNIRLKIKVFVSPLATIFLVIC